MIDFTTFYKQFLTQFELAHRSNNPADFQNLLSVVEPDWKVEEQDLYVDYCINKAGIYVSTGSACDSTSIEPSHVLKAINVPLNYINASIRFSIGEYTTFEEVEHSVETLINILTDIK